MKCLDNKSDVGGDNRSRSAGTLQQVETRHREATGPVYQFICSSKPFRSFHFGSEPKESYISGK